MQIVMPRKLALMPTGQPLSSVLTKEKAMNPIRMDAVLNDEQREEAKDALASLAKTLPSLIDLTPNV